nr:voltage gated hydrogen channel 1 [Hymenolepis microstoma]
MLMLDIDRLQSMDPVRIRNFEVAKFSIECISLSIVSFFLIEIFLKLCVFGIKLYTHSLIETIDALVICISFGIDVYIIVTAKHFSSESAVSSSVSSTETVNSLPEAAGFLVLFRLWRIVRIANAILISVSASQEAKINELKAERDKATFRATQLEDFIISLGYNIPSDKVSPDPI